MCQSVDGFQDMCILIGLKIVRPCIDARLFQLPSFSMRQLLLPEKVACTFPGKVPATF